LHSQPEGEVHGSFEILQRSCLTVQRRSTKEDYQDPQYDLFKTKEICTTDIRSCYEMNPTKLFHPHPELVDGEGQFASTKLCPMCNKVLCKDTLPKNCIASGVDFGICEGIKELTKPNTAEQSVIERYRIFEEVVKFNPTQAPVQAIIRII
jgi:hypothetical protein